MPTSAYYINHLYKHINLTLLYRPSFTLKGNVSVNACSFRDSDGHNTTLRTVELKFSSSPDGYSVAESSNGTAPANSEDLGGLKFLADEFKSGARPYAYDLPSSLFPRSEGRDIYLVALCVYSTVTPCGKEVCTVETQAITTVFFRTMNMCSARKTHRQRL